MQTEYIPIEYNTRFVGLPLWCTGGNDLVITLITNLDINGVDFTRVLKKNANR